MCGLAGRFHPVRLPAAPGWAERASALLAHRGPDGAGCFRDDRCELVHRRLAIIDLSPGGHQPMANEDGTVQVVFNGEIYNHRELRRDLQRRGHLFRGSCDTEVLVHLYEEHGEWLVERLRGIFAFALYDRPRRRLLLARDRFGVKPLFYTRVDPEGQWVFASELKAIAALPGFEPRIDRQACWDFLGFGYIPEPATGFADVHAVPPGAMVTVTPGRQRLEWYHAVQARPNGSHDVRESADRLSGALEEAVGRQSLADVPVAALLSGGIDSSLVVAAHRRAMGVPTTTFNVRFPDPEHDETAMARAVAQHCGTRHHVIHPESGRLSTEATLDLFRHFDQPFADTSLIPMYWVSAAVRDRGIVCALSGDGGDEVFGGYARFWRANRLAVLMNMPGWMRHAAGGAGRAVAGLTRDFGRQVAKAAWLAEAGRRDTAELLGGLSSYLSEEQKAELVRPDARQALLPGWRHFEGWRPEGAPDLEGLSRRLTETLFAVSLPSDMLRKVDMMSMRAGIEVRVPLLDESLVDLGLSLPHQLKTDGRRGKLVLRALARRWLPDQVARHPKHGFTIPLDVMVSGSFHEAIQDLLAGPGARTPEFLDRGVVRRWASDFAAGNGRGGGTMSREGLAQRVFMLLALELWLRDYRLSW